MRPRDSAGHTACGGLAGRRGGTGDGGTTPLAHSVLGEPRESAAHPQGVATPATAIAWNLVDSVDRRPTLGYRGSEHRIGGAEVMAAVVCSACGTQLRERAKFCDECGAPTTAAPAATYRQVTVLFADVVGSMGIAAAVDIERYREIMGALVEGSATAARRFGGSVEYTGDGVMVIFGVPVALEDHALRACLAALAIQEAANRLAAEVLRRDGVELRVRVGINSGRVIAGEIGSGAPGYRAVGETVGFAQRIESVAPPGGVMVSEATARLVEELVVLGEPEPAHIKGMAEPVRVCRLISAGHREGPGRRTEAQLVGRDGEMAALAQTVDRVLGGRGQVVTLSGPAGIGKSRAAREIAAVAAERGVEVFWAACESHTCDVPFLAVARILRAGAGLADLEGEAARERLRAFVGASIDQPDHRGNYQQDLQLLEDFLGVADPDAARPPIDPDARRRRLTAFINSVTLARRAPALYVIEDVHWIDAVSESMIAGLLEVIPRTPSLVLITSRTEYKGMLSRVDGAQAITLEPLADADTATLVAELLGTDLSVAELAAVIVERAAGNPFFAEEIVRELAQRGTLSGSRGQYRCHTDAGEVSVPVTVQAAIEARIDRLSAQARRTLSAGAVIGARFDADLLSTLEADPVLDELLAAELIDHERFTQEASYQFRHPLIRAVAYESQLKSDRAELHRRLAAAIESHDPDATDENAALIAEHQEAAGDSHAAYGWHMRAASWSVSRDVAAARVSWERARRIADRLPDDDVARLAMRIAPRTMLCATDWQAITESHGRFDELREMCTATGDDVSLAIGMSGRLAELLYAGRAHQQPALPAEQMALLASIEDPGPMIGLAPVAFNMWWDTGEFDELLRWSDIVVDRADGDPVRGTEYGAFGSPLAAALAWRSIARWWLGRSGWQQDIREAESMARKSGDPTIIGLVTLWTSSLAISHGVSVADDAAVRAAEEALHATEGSSDATAAVIALGLGITLLSRDPAADRARGLDVMVAAREKLSMVPMPLLVPIAELWIAREQARRGDLGAAIPAIRSLVVDLHSAPRCFFGVWGADVLAEALLARRADGDLDEAQRVIDGLSQLRADGSAMLEITRMRMRVRVAGARGDLTYGALLSEYRASAEAFGFHGHIAWAHAAAGGAGL